MANLVKADEKEPGKFVTPEKFRLRVGEMPMLFLIGQGQRATATVRDESVAGLKRHEGPVQKTASVTWKSPYTLIGRRVGTTTIFLSDPGYNKTVIVEVMAAAPGFVAVVSQLRFYPAQRLPGTTMLGALYVVGQEDVRVPATCSPQHGLGAASRTATPPEPGLYVLGAPSYVSWNLRRNGHPTPHYIHTLPTDLLGRDPRTREMLANEKGSIFLSQHARQRLIGGRLLQPGTPFEVMKPNEVGPVVY